MKFTSEQEYIIIDDLYDEEELSVIWKELLFLTSPRKLLYPSETNSARMGGIDLKKNRAVWLEQIYTDPLISDILVKSRKLFSLFESDVFKKHLIMHPITYVNRDTSLLSYYEENDYYQAHHDDTMFTACTWFVREPRMFEGGDLVLIGHDNQKHTVELKNNRCVIFRGATRHQVLPVTKYTGAPFSGCGRYTLSQFMTVI